MVAVAILAAGRGSRMKSELPKVLHTLSGRSLLDRVLDSCSFVHPSRCLVVVGFAAEQVKQALNAREGTEFVEQRQQLGTGHALQQLLSPLEGYTGDLLVLNGDVPLLRPETLQKLLQTHQTYKNAATFLTAQLEHPKGYGRVFCDQNNFVQKIIEDRDCTPAQKENPRINAGVYCFNWDKLAPVLPKLSAENEQQEYYLTDVFPLLNRVMAVDVEDNSEIMGINDRKQLAAANDTLQARVKEAGMAAGATLINPDSITIEETVKLQPDVVIEPQTHLRGNTVIASGSRIGPGSLIENSRIGENVTVQYSVISDSVVKGGSQIGPYAHIRGKVELGEACSIGNFVELKNSQMGAHSNAKHLSYLGDTTTGEQVNIACGTITANYDGVSKHRTQISDRTKTGCNSVLVAPVTLGEDVTVAAGSVITKNVSDDTLAIARSRQVVKKGWRLKRQ